MKAGRMDRRITIEQPSESQDAFGEPDQAWSTLATVWAEVRPDTGAERHDAEQILAKQGLVFRIRFRSDVTREMRVDYESEKYDIQSIVEPQGTRHEVLELRGTARAVA